MIRMDRRTRTFELSFIFFSYICASVIILVQSCCFPSTLQIGCARGILLPHMGAALTFSDFQKHESRAGTATPDAVLPEPHTDSSEYTVQPDSERAGGRRPSVTAQKWLDALNKVILGRVLLVAILDLCEVLLRNGGGSGMNLYFFLAQIRPMV